MIRSSKHSLKFVNHSKRQELKIFFVEYRRLLQAIIDKLWVDGLEEFGLDIQSNQLDCLSMLPNDYLKTFDSWLTARMKQCVGKQVCSMVKAAVAKRKKQLYMLAKLQRNGDKTKHLQRKIDTQPLVKPNADHAKLELDSRFIDFKESQHFDSFVRIKTIGNKLELLLPIKYTKVSHKWSKLGEMKDSIRLEENSLHLIYEIPDLVKKTEGLVVGADQGQTTVLSLSDNQVTSPNEHGYDLTKIQSRLACRKKGSNGFRRTQEHRKNYINWSLNQLNFSKTKEVKLEKIKGLRYKQRSSRLMSHWAYTLIKDKLVDLSEVEGFKLTEVANEFRSQRCSQCGWVCKANRKGKTFKCNICGFTKDADLNAASNLSLDLHEVPFWVRSSKINRKGFYWKPNGLFSKDHEPIVRDTK